MPTNLPTAPNAFVGRESDVDELLRLLTAARLVTLCGTGGIGKTRLALNVAQAAAETFSDGVWLVELADLDGDDLLDETVAIALGVPVEELAGALTGGRQLIVFDNCEHVVEASAALCTRLLAICPELRVLATSREPLRVAGETVWRVPPLSLISAKPSASDAVRLFVERSQAATGERWTDADDAAVAELCSELEGIPLAIELAAAMTRVLSVEQIRSRLSDRFKLLTSGSRSAPARQRTLLATVEWSYRMLSQPARVLLQRLTAFRGGWTLWMAESVCPCDGLDADEVLGTMAELVDKSLVIADGKYGGEVRYRMLDTVRDYARQRLLDSGDEAELRDRHFDCCCELARKGAELIGLSQKESWPETVRFFHALDAIQANLYSGMAHGIGTGQLERVLRVVCDLQWALVGAGRFDEATRHIDRALELATDAPAGLLGQATSVRAFICFYAGDLEGLQRHATTALKLSRAGGNLPGEITSTLMLCLIGLGSDDVSVERAAELADEYADISFLGFVHYTRALLAQLAGQLREAQRHFESLLVVLRESSEWGMAQAVIGLAQLAHARGDLAGAVEHYEHAQSLLSALDYRGDRIRCLTGLGKIAIELGDFGTARARLAESLSLSTGLGQRANAVDLVEAFTDLAHRSGDQQRAVRLAAASTALRERMGGAIAGGAGARTEDVLAPARRDLGETTVARLWREGLELSWNRTIDYAVSGSLTATARSITQIPAAPNSVLTEREREIVVLISRGLSNRALAEELVISPATVARHVSNILAKLGFASRTQVAAWAVEHGMNE